MVPHEPAQPAVQADRLTRIPAANEFDAAPEFPDDQHAEMDLAFGDSGKPGGNMGARASSLTKLGDDIRVE